jgi:hypothetical protein
MFAANRHPVCLKEHACPFLYTLFFRKKKVFLIHPRCFPSFFRNPGPAAGIRKIPPGPLTFCHIIDSWQKRFPAPGGG